MEIAKQLRNARRRHEQLGLSEEEAAFYDALAGGIEDVKADPELAKIAHELVGGIRTDLTVDWADREATEARIRAKIKRLTQAQVPAAQAPDQTVAGAATYATSTTPRKLCLTKPRRCTAPGRMSRPLTGCSPDLKPLLRM